MFGLSFLAPLYLLGMLAAAVPIALHLLRRRVETVVDFPAQRLLPATAVHQQRRRRLRELVLLALRVSALVLLSAAFARPYLAGALPAGAVPVTVVALDTSFSMTAPGVFDRARSLAVEALSEAGTGDAVAFVTFDDRAVTRVEATLDRSRAVAAVAAVQPGAAGTSYGALVARAAELLRDRGGRLVVVTDRQQAGWVVPAWVTLPDDVGIEVRDVETPIRNLAVTRVGHRDGRVEADLHNFGVVPRDVVVRLHVRGHGGPAEAGQAWLSPGDLPAPAAEMRVRVPARGTVQVRFAQPTSAAGAAAVSVEDGAGPAADDVRFLVLEDLPAVRVTVLVADPAATRGGLYVERALDAADPRRFAVTVADGRALAADGSDTLQTTDALVLLGTRTLDRQGRARVSRYIAGGGSVLVSAGPDIDPATLGDVLGLVHGVAAEPSTFRPAAALVIADRRHPVFRPFVAPVSALGDIRFERYRTIDETGRAVLARFSGGAPALLEEPRPAGRILWFASDLDNRWNRLPLSPAFVPFLVEAVSYLTEGVRPAREWLLPGVPPGVTPAPGIFVVPAGAASREPRLVAVNVDPRESNPAALPADSLFAAVPRAPRAGPAATGAADVRRAEQEQRLWQAGLLLMAVALAGEGLVGRRVG